MIVVILRHVGSTKFAFVGLADFLVMLSLVEFLQFTISFFYYQVLRPSTRQKLHVVGDTYHKVLLEHLQSVPTFLGGHCTCIHCHKLSVGSAQCLDQAAKRELNLNFVDELGDSYLTDLPVYGNWDQILRTAIIGILMLWIFIAFIASMYGPDGHSLWAS